MSKTTVKVMALSVSLALVTWVIDAYVDSVYYYHAPFLDMLLFKGPPHEIYIRSLIAGLFLIFGALMSWVLSGRARVQQALQNAKEDLEVKVAERTENIRSVNERLQDELERRTSAEEVLRESEEHFRSLIEHGSDLITVVSADAAVLYCSPSVERLLGYGVEEVLGRSAFGFMDDGSAAAARETLSAVLQDAGPVKAVELRLRRKEGAWRIFESIGRSRRDRRTGEPVAVFNSRDITSRKEMERALEEGEDRFRRLFLEFRTLLDAIPGSITLLSRDLRVLWANRGAQQMSGDTAPHVTLRLCHELWHNRSEACDDCPAMRSFATGKPETSRVVRAGGGIWDLTALPIDDGRGTVETVMVLGNDVTEAVTRDAELLRSAHLASIGQLAAGVAHEINNPMNSIINYAELLAGKLAGAARERDLAERIVKEGGRVAQIVKSLLFFSRQAGEARVPVNLDEVLSDALDLVRSRMEKEGIRLDVRLDPGLPPVRANPQQMQQVVLNIIDNARYALGEKYPVPHEDKKLEITGGPVTVDGRPHAALSFLDGGTGIPPAVLRKVMVPFFTTKPLGKGTGLGLSISHGIVADHGGTLAIDSAEGRYTRAVITLPALERGNG